jgi:excisionase family DNA binding protein
MKTHPGISGFPYYSTSDLAKLLGVDNSTIKRWADLGEIPCVKTLGGHRRFTQDTVSALTAKMNINAVGAIPKIERGPGQDRKMSDNVAEE